MPLVEIDHLTVSFSGRTAVDDVSLHLDRGQTLALVGESGSGKSVTARTLVGLVGAGAEVDARRIAFDGADLRGLRDREWRRLRGRRIGYVLQDALVSLDPIRPVGREIDEALRASTDLDRAERDRRVVELLGRVGVPRPEWRATQLPGQLSGGLRQRALIAAALAGDPDLLIADEPTTALDVTVQAQIVELLRDLTDDDHALLMISHDLAVVASLADRVAVMSAGRIVEEGDVDDVFERPSHDDTRALLQAVPAEHAKGTRLSPRSGPPISRDTARAGERRRVVVRATDLHRSFAGPGGRRHVAVGGVSFEVRAGETLGIVGESGSGKTTTGRLVVGLDTPDDGTVTVADAEGIDRGWASLDRRGRRALRRAVQTIYQDPSSSFDPRWTVGRLLGEAVRAGEAGPEARGERLDRAGVRGRVSEMLGQVGLDPEFAGRRPATLSGGQRQRVAIARALATRPRVILLDEPVSALDVSVQAQVLDLLDDVRAATGVAFLFISHDLGVVRHVADRVLVMKDGVVVESGDVETVFSRPAHPYTRQLVRSIPRLPGRRAPGEALATAPQPTRHPSTGRFSPTRRTEDA
jgi:peptide/nickel transport system ATP-binding protein